MSAAPLNRVMTAGAQFMSDGLQRDAEGNGCIERSLRTLKEQILRVRHIETLGKLAEALEQFRQRNNERWLVERLHFQSPRQAHQAQLVLERDARR
ncbi:MAG: hypothetical protein ACOYX1_12115 [Acidobacteriota bacterium]